MWGYYDGYTAAQIELMIADSPIVSYNREKRKKGEFDKQSAYAVLSSKAKYQQADNKPKTLSELGFSNPQGINLSKE